MFWLFCPVCPHEVKWQQIWPLTIRGRWPDLPGISWLFTSNGGSHRVVVVVVAVAAAVVVAAAAVVVVVVVVAVLQN
ncbi:hypothetical protein ElyMa_001863400 [Elysia marginata]|uniref:Uncharacterized protein n=1 Tax=Elysia marginata TaxID=1093978 RepID=A0AAV4ENQ0_9GAST|nr:hypothetical protein ElyMa_001863400 [Elysia marginata]